MRRKRRNRQRRIIVCASIPLLLIMTVGYAAFQTNLNIRVKGNIIDNTLTIPELKSKYCNATLGDGLYVDTTEEGRCVYRGSNPNNYITFNGEEYRIVAVESDGTLKIIKSESLGDRAFEEANTRTAAYCNDNSNGCNVWGSSTTMLDASGNNITAMPTEIGSSALALPIEESQIAKYLNNDYYNTLSEEAKSQVDNHLWNVGVLKIASGQTLETDLEQENANKWRGNIGLINPSDYVKASNSSSCTSVHSANNGACGTNNYLKSGSDYWTMSPIPSSFSSCFVRYVASSGAFGTSIADNGLGVRPVLYLTSEIGLEGVGSQSQPFTIKAK